MFANLFKRFTRATGNTQTQEQARQLIALGNRLEEVGELRQACDLYRRAVQEAPTLPAAHLNLGIVLAAMGDSGGAERAYATALALDPGHPFVNYNFANLVYGQGDLVRAESLVRRALQAQSDLVQAHVLLSNVLDDSGRTDAAMAAVREAIRLQPDYLGARYNLATLLYKARQLAEAMSVTEDVLKTDPAHVDAHSLRASILQDQGLLRESLQSLRQAMVLGSQRLDLRSRELFALNFDENTEARDLFQRHMDFGACMEAAVAARFDGAHRGSLDPRRRLRLGYVSGDLFVHPVALFLLPVLECHDRTDFEVICYSCGSRKDHITARLRQVSDRWVDAYGMSEPRLAQQIYDDAVDILIDLSGHSGAVRLAVFSEKPAPIQISWLGYLNTTGLTRIDYRLCGALSDPPTSATLHTEALLTLPETQWCYRPFLSVACEPTLPAVRNGHVTFGSFNHASKISVRMCERWAKILLRVPDSRLLICGVTPGPKLAQIQQALAHAGIAGERIQCEPRVDLDLYYRIFDRVDIALDSYPYGGGTTTLDSLWMGVPVVTAMGALPVSRSASSILQCLGLNDWVADSIGRYEDVAVAQASDLFALASTRAGLRNRLATSSLMDEMGFMVNLESLLRQAWARYCSASIIDDRLTRNGQFAVE